MSNKKKTGTAEWAEKTVNIQYGCEHNCIYCYSRKMAQRFNRVPILGWDHPEIKSAIPDLPTQTTVMFPSTHDITHGNLHLCTKVIQYLIERGNHILIVSKPHIECITAICEMFCQWQSFIEFRFSIGSRDDAILKYYEPNAPTFDERITSIRCALDHSFKVSVSCEPLLKNDLYFIDLLLAFTHIKNGVNLQIDTIWIGAIQYMKGPELDYRGIYDEYRDNPKIKFKDSFFNQAQKQGVIF